MSTYTPNAQFLKKYNVGKKNEWWEVDTVGNCGEMYFKGVVLVHDPLNKLPGIQVSRPMGLRGLKKALSLIEEERGNLGIETLQ